MFKKFMDINPEVEKALEEGTPVIALESTIISHGMPYPKNVETALAVEEVIRKNGAIPATIGIIKGRIKIGLTKDEVEYMAADEEDGYIIAQASEPRDENGAFINKKIKVRYLDEIIEVEREKVDYIDVSPKQLVSVGAAMIPFLEHDDANRALMGANMQRQAVPLMITDSPIVGTGIEYRAAKDSGITILAKEAGVVQKVTGDEIIIKTKAGIDTYKLRKFKRTNGGTCINQKPIVVKGEEVKEGDVIADGPSTQNGEMALGKNVLIAFTTSRMLFY